MPTFVTLTGFWTATGSSRREIVVNLTDGTAVEIKSQRRTGRRYQSRITNPTRLARLIEQARQQLAAGK